MICYNFLHQLTVTSQSSTGWITFHRLLLRQCQMESRNCHRNNELLKEKETEMAAAQSVSAVMQLDTGVQLLH